MLLRDGAALLGPREIGGPAAAERAVELYAIREELPARRERVLGPEAAASAPQSPVTSASTDDASPLFRAAVASLNAGRAAEAARSFSAFLARFPRDSRAEDAAYLRVLALQRSGNTAATQQAAHEYLARYPQGFRRAEVDALTR